MKLSIAVCTHNEGYYVQDLLNLLVPIVIREPAHYELIVVDDYSTESVTIDALNQYDNVIYCYEHELNNDFATHKNFMNSLCNGDFILNLDADEMLSGDLISQIPLIIDSNPNVDAYWFPRINTVDGLTLSHVRKWGWVITSQPELTRVESIRSVTADFYDLLSEYNLIYREEDGFVYYYEPVIQWPDPQMRLYRNDPKIKWVGKVHERLEGFDNFTNLPMTLDYAIIHKKEIERQIEQNSVYESLIGR